MNGGQLGVPKNIHSKNSLNMICCVLIYDVCFVFYFLLYLFNIVSTNQRINKKINTNGKLLTKFLFFLSFAPIFSYVKKGKDVFSPEVESSPAPSSTEPQNIPMGVKQTSRTSSFEIENLLKTAEQVN